jgi:hypothetical protein
MVLRSALCFKITVFNVRNEITHKLYLISLIHNVFACEPLFKQDRQFNNIEQVKSKITVQMGVDINISEIYA